MPATVTTIAVTTIRRRESPLAGALACMLVFALSACGGGGGSGKTTQVAVKVNKDEITVQQVNEQLSRLPAGTSPEQAEPATRQILSSLVNQQLLVQQALERKLDRDPQILGALEGARLNILAQAYVQRVIAPQAKPTEQEVKKYYADNPALFAERKVYRLQELSIEANAEQEKEIESAAASAKSLKQLADYLRDKKIPFAADSGVRTAEQLPLARVARISQLKPGEVLVFPTSATRVSALEVLASEAQPVDDKKATPAIEQYLANKKQEELARLELKRLRDAAKVEYVGDFTKYAADAASTSPVAAAAPAAAPGNGEDKGIAALK
jgi:EpsD family peptidyl-prolyl cis-trans isomerase